MTILFLSLTTFFCFVFGRKMTTEHMKLVQAQQQLEDRVGKPLLGLSVSETISEVSARLLAELTCVIRIGTASCEIGFLDNQMQSKIFGEIIILLVQKYFVRKCCFTWFHPECVRILHVLSVMFVPFISVQYPVGILLWTLSSKVYFEIYFLVDSKSLDVATGINLKLCAI